MLFWDLHLGRGYSCGEWVSWRQPCTLGVSRLTVLACFHLSGGNVFSFIPAKTRQHGRWSCRRALHKLEVTWEQPGVSVKATCDRHSSIWSKVFLGSSVDSQQLSFLFVYCLVFTHYGSVLVFVSCKKMKNIITTFPFTLGFLTFSWCRVSQIEKSEILWTLHILDGISGGSSTFSVWIFSKSALPTYYLVTNNFVKSHAKKFYFSLHCLRALMLQKTGTSVSCGSGVYDWFIIRAPLKSNSLHLLGKTDCQTVSLLSLSPLVCPSTWVTVAGNSRTPTGFTKRTGYLSLKDNLNQNIPSHSWSQLKAVSRTSLKQCSTTVTTLFWNFIMWTYSKQKVTSR